MRRPRLINSGVQLAMLAQSGIHWTLFATATFVLLMLCQLLDKGPEASLDEHLAVAWTRFAPVLLVLVVLIPAMAYDSMRLSNRLVGPMTRFQNALRNVAQGEAVGPLSFRKGDLWSEMADDFNVLLDRLDASDAPGPAEETDEPRGDEPSPVLVAAGPTSSELPWS